MENKTACKSLIGTPTVFSCIRLHEAPANYFSTVYMTFLSVFQGIILAQLVSKAFGLMPPFDSPDFRWDVNSFDHRAVRLLPVAVFAVLLWHKYINHHQFLGWQIAWKDTCLIAGFGLLEGAMVLWGWEFRNPYLIQALLAASLGWGSLAYLHARQEHRKKYVQEVFGRHFACDGVCREESSPCNAAEEVRKFMLKYESLAHKVTLMLALAVFIVGVISAVARDFLSPLSPAECVVIELVWSLLATGLMVWFLIVLDLRPCMEGVGRDRWPRKGLWL